LRPGGRAEHARPPPDAELPPPRHLSSRWLAARLRALAGPLRGARLCVAFSGGLDSTVLLAALAPLRTRAGIAVRALHVDHALHPHSARWAAAARAAARSLEVPCRVLRVRIAPRRGASLEALAREARYAALTGQLRDGEWLLTAHHEDDQLETLLLALTRGSGVRGLAAMSARGEIHGRPLLRPLLPLARAELERYARRHRLGWSEDLTNLDERFDRNYLRRRVLPLLRARWPAVAATAGRSAALLAEAQSLLGQAAQRVLDQAADGPALRVSVLRALAPAQRRNALQCWLAARGLALPDHRRLREIAGPMLAARPDATPLVRWQGGQLRRHGDRLFALAAGPLPAPHVVARWNWRRRGWLELGDGSALGLTLDRHGDLDLDLLPCPLRVAFRRGGERLQEAHGRVPLKDLLQARGLAPWQRAHVPLLRRGARILAVADLWLDPAVRAGVHTRGARGRLRWRRAHH
jgi:tRNA(Ile)-lysidine synthase